MTSPEKIILQYNPCIDFLGIPLDRWNENFLLQWLKNFNYTDSEEEGIKHLEIQSLKMVFRYSSRPAMMLVHISHPEFRVMDIRVMGMSKQNLKNVFHQKGFKKPEESKEWGVSMVCYDHEKISFFFDSSGVDECVVELY